MRHIIRMSGIAVLLGLPMAAPVTPASAEPAVQLDIQSVTVSYKPSGEPDTLLITGVNFGSLAGRVVLNGIDQTVTHWAPTWIAATVSDVVEPGTYQLDVRRTDASGAVFRDEADVAVGAMGPQGPAGPAGTQGEPGVSGYEVVSRVAQFVTNEGVLTGLAATCPLGKKVLGGGCYTLEGIQGAELKVTEPSDDNRGWRCYWHGPHAEIRMKATAICANVQ
jgi:hypothetical protein